MIQCFDDSCDFRFDLLQVDHGTTNDTIVARATNIGQTTLKVWDRERPALVDYVMIDVGYAISPADSRVSVGDVICLQSFLTNSNGTWLHAFTLLSN